MAKKGGGLTQTDINKAVYIDREYYIRDTEVRQLFYRVKEGNKFSWVVRYTDPETGEKRRKFTLAVPTNRLADARQAAVKFFSELISGGNPAKKQKILSVKSLTLEEALKLYEPYAKNLRSGKSVIYDLIKIMKWEKIGKKPINNISRQDLNKFIEEEKRKNTARTINKKITLLYGMMSKLYEEEEIERESVKLPRKPKKIPETDSNKTRRYFEPDERLNLINTAKGMTPKWLCTAVLVSLNTGMRPRSLFNLTWDDLDFKTLTIRLSARHMKTNDEWVIPMNKKTEEALSEWKKQVPENQNLIFVGNSGGAVKQDEWTDNFNALIKKAGITGVTWYNMRHDFASQLVMKGVSLYTVKDLMCHKNITTTQVYAHLSPDQKSAAVALLDKL